MKIKSDQEALFVACEMERGAIQLYERALSLMGDDLGQENSPLRDRLESLLADEVRHLRQFQELYVGLDESVERMMALSAVAGGVLFEGGLMGAAREGLLDSVPRMMRSAIQEEEKAARIYRDFASQCDDQDAKFMLETIADEEDRHLQDLREQVSGEA